MGLRIHNTENLDDRVMGISLSSQHQLKPDVVCCVLDKVVQSNARDQLEVHLFHVRMSTVKGREKMKGHLLDVLSTVEKSTVIVKESFIRLSQALIIVMARVNCDTK